ncbi:MAG: glycosyl transferase family 4 [Nanoarchaeota archaeon]
MVNFILFLFPLIAFFISLFCLKLWIVKTHQIGLVWDDMNKIGAKKVAGSGGIIVVFSFLIGIFLYISYRTFFIQTELELFKILSLSCSILFLAGIGLIDDLLGWQRGGLSKTSRILLVIIAAIPLTAINVGKSQIALPFFGMIDTGLLYPLLLVPIGIVGAATTFNFLAGFNGLEAGQGVLLLSGLGLVAYSTGSGWISVICFCMVFALLAFLVYNWYPAQVFPGDVLTYSVGGLIAMAAILGNFEKIAIFFFIPNMLEVFLKARGGLIKQSFGKPNADGSLDLRYDKLYSLNHIALWIQKKVGRRPSEKVAVLLILAFQLIIILLGLFIFRESVFL